MIEERIQIGDQGDFTIVPATGELDCVDPRPRLEVPDQGTVIFDSSEYPGAERSPGATLGLVMTLKLAVPQLTIPDAFQLVIRQLTTDRVHNPPFHGDDSDHGLGCGHADNAEKDEYAGLYGLSADDIAQMKNQVERLTEIGLLFRRSQRSGPHVETSVIVVNSLDSTVVPVTHSVFRFDASRHDARLGRLADYAAAHEYLVTGDQLREAARRQREATLGIIAADLPVYNINLHSGQRQVEYRGKVPSLRR